MESPLEVSQVRHLLALLSESGSRELIEQFVDKVDANRSGDIEFEELVTLIRAVNPQLMRMRELSDVELEAHPLLDQVQLIADGATLDLMDAHPDQLEGAARRAAMLATVIRRLDGDTSVPGGGSPSKGPPITQDRSRLVDK